jgi:large subunit ribosomal protein L9
MAAEKLAVATAQGEKLKGTIVKITQKAGVDGRLFGSVTTFDIAEELGKMGFEVTKANIRLTSGLIKTVGDAKIHVVLHTDMIIEVTVSVYGETA